MEPQDDQENVPLDGERTMLNPGSRVSIASSPRRPLTLDQLFGFSLRSDSDETSLLKRKFGSLEQEGSCVSQPTVMLKKARTTDIAAASVELQQNIEVRLENVSQPREAESEKPAEPEGRARRQGAGQVSYKERWIFRRKDTRTRKFLLLRNTCPGS